MFKMKVAQSCLTLCDPMNDAVHGIFQARILEWVAFPFSRGSSQPRGRTQISRIAGGFFTRGAPREALMFKGKPQNTCLEIFNTHLVRPPKEADLYINQHCIGPQGIYDSFILGRAHLIMIQIILIVNDSNNRGLKHEPSFIPLCFPFQA